MNKTCSLFEKLIIAAVCASVCALVTAEPGNLNACTIAFTQSDSCYLVSIGSAGLTCGPNTVRLGVTDTGSDDCNAIDVQLEVEDPTILSVNTTSFSFPDTSALPEDIIRACGARLTEVEVTGLKAGRTKVHFSSRPLGYTDRPFTLVTSQTVEVRCPEETTTSTTTTAPATDVTVNDLTLLVESVMLTQEIVYADLKEVLDTPDAIDINTLQEAASRLEEAGELLVTAVELVRQLRDASQILISTAFTARGLLTRAEAYGRWCIRAIGFSIKKLNDGTPAGSARAVTNVRLTARLLQEAYQTNEAVLDLLNEDASQRSFVHNGWTVIRHTDD